MIKKCDVCGKEFDAVGSSKYCSEDCRKTNRYKRQKTYREKNARDYVCKYCGKTFHRFRERGSFCSRSCVAKFHIESGAYDAWRLRTNPKKLPEERCGIIKQCVICGEDYFATRTIQDKMKTCGKEECKEQYRKTIKSKYMSEHNPMQGVSPTEEMKAKCRATMMERYGVPIGFLLNRPAMYSKPQQQLTEILTKQFKKLCLLSDALLSKDDKRCKTDILIKELNIAIEFNGTYWHCDPRFYEPNYFHQKKQMTAQQIWEQDAERQKFIESLGYRVFVVWEYDFAQDREKTLKFLIDMIQYTKGGKNAD